MSDKQCICTVLEEINGFDGINEFYRFQKYISDLIATNELTRIPVKYFYTGLKHSPTEVNEVIKKRMSGYPKKNGIVIVPEKETLKDEWYKCLVCGGIWRLVYPDFPFKGIWEKVED